VGPACPGDSPRALALPPAPPGTLAALVRVLYTGQATIDREQVEAFRRLLNYVFLLQGS
jgi:hypothetical protein